MDGKKNYVIGSVSFSLEELTLDETEQVLALIGQFDLPSLSGDVKVMDIGEVISLIGGIISQAGQKEILKKLFATILTTKDGKKESPEFMGQIKRSVYMEILRDFLLDEGSSILNGIKDLTNSLISKTVPEKK